MMNSNETLDDIQWQTLIQQTAGFFSDLTIKRDFSITSKVVSTPASRQMRPVWSGFRGWNGNLPYQASPSLLRRQRMQLSR